MATNLNIDPKLLDRALKIGGKKTKRETVNEALEEYIKYRERLKFLELEGTVDFDPGWDYKADRRRKSR